MSKKHFSMATTLVASLILIFSFQNCGQSGTTTAGDGSSSAGGGSNGGNSGSGGNNGGSGGNSGGGNNGGGSGSGAPDTPEGQFFDQTVMPVLQTNCMSCHGLLPKDSIGGATSGIYSYNYMKNLTFGATSTTSNNLISRVRGTLPHSAPDLCAFGGFTGTPCRELIEWMTLENPLLSDGPIGTVTNISATGRVSGWALDPQDGGAIIDIIIYGDGPVGVGTLLATIPANQAGFGPQNGHIFTYDLPAGFRNANQHQLYIYTEAANANNLIPGAPYTYTAYTPNPAGLAYYNANLQADFQQCAGCHGGAANMVYDYHYSLLLSPTPANGATSMTNRLVQKAAGINHGGPTYCGGNVNAGFCAEIQAWWDIEFGP